MAKLEPQIDAHDEDLVQAEYAESNGGQGFCDQVRFKKLSRAWWHKPLISALGRQRQMDFWIWSQPGLQSKFQDSQGYTEKSCLKKPKQTNKQTKSFKKLSLVSLSRDWKETSCSQRIPCVLSLIRLYWKPGSYGTCEIFSATSTVAISLLHLVTLSF